MTSEYGHCMGNALGNLQEYWDEIYSHPRMLGGFIWDWVDQGLYKETEDGERYIAYGGDFGDYPNLKAFCLNGILFSDRSLTPKYHELSKVYQPVSIKGVSLEPGQVEVEIINRNHHVNLAYLAGDWRLEMDGKVIQSGNLPRMVLPPGQEEYIGIPVNPIREPVPGGDYWLSIQFSLKEDTSWAEKGHIVAWDQFRLEVPTADFRNDKESSPKVLSSDSEDLYQVSGPNFSVTFSKEEGMLDSLKYNGREMLTGPSPVLEAYRAYTDNDKGFGKWLAKDWKEAGLNSLQRQPALFSSRRVSEDCIEISVTKDYQAQTGYIRTEMTWEIFGDGAIFVHCDITPEGDLPPLPRVALQMQLNSELENFHWYGHGPLENYPDRLRSAPIGVWKRTVTSQYVPYPRPQDTGNKEGVRWLSLTDEDDSGLMFSTLDGRPFSASALHFTTKDLDEATHTFQLDPRPEVILTLKARESGLGNSSCGPGVLTRYAVPVQPYSFSFSIQPLSRNEDAAQLSRKYLQPFNN